MLIVGVANADTGWNTRLYQQLAHDFCRLGRLGSKLVRKIALGLCEIELIN